MRVIPMSPNYLKKGNAHGKDGATKGHEPKKRTEIPNAIKTADEVIPALKKAGKGVGSAKKVKGRVTKGKSKLSGVRNKRRLARTRPGSQDSTFTRGQDDP